MCCLAPKACDVLSPGRNRKEHRKHHPPVCEGGFHSGRPRVAGYHPPLRCTGPRPTPSPELQRWGLASAQDASFWDWSKPVKRARGPQLAPDMAGVAFQAWSLGGASCYTATWQIWPWLDKLLGLHRASRFHTLQPLWLYRTQALETSFGGKTDGT